MSGEGIYFFSVMKSELFFNFKEAAKISSNNPGNLTSVRV